MFGSTKFGLNPLKTMFKQLGLEVNVSSPISNLVLRLVKIFSGVKIHANWRLVLKACKIFT